MDDNKFWRIRDFAEEIGRSRGEKPPHVNTVDGWFKQLEEKHVHYVNRVGNEKLYDEQDLKIALHIRERREQKWALEGIFNELPERFELRPAPIDEPMPPAQDLEQIRQQLLKSFRAEMQLEIQAAVEQRTAALVQELEQIRKQLPEAIETAVSAQAEETKQSLLQQLPKPKDPAEERQQRITEAITRRRVESALEREALELWSQKPELERMRKAGWFRKEEDADKRQRFVREYIDQHFAERLQKEYEIL